MYKKLQGINETTVKITSCVTLVLMCCLIQNSHLKPGAFSTLSKRSSSSSEEPIQLQTDFPSFYYASKGILLGGNIYDTRFLDSLKAADNVKNHVLPYVYPPFLAIIVSPLTLLPPDKAEMGWSVLSVVLFCVSIIFTVLTPVSTRQLEITDAKNQKAYWVAISLLALLLFLLIPFGDNLDLGQSNHFVLVCICMAFFFFINMKNDMVVGLLLGVASLIKVIPAMLIVPFIIHRRTKVLYGFLAAIVAFIGIAIMICGVKPWDQFVEFLPHMKPGSAIPGGAHPILTRNISLAGFSLRVFGAGPLAGFASLVTSILLFATVLYYSLRKGQNELDERSILPYSVLMIIVSPIASLHHIVYIFPGAVFALRYVWLHFSGKRRAIRFGLLLLTVLLSSFDFFYYIYDRWQMPEGLRPYATSMNLYALLGLLFLAMVIMKEEGNSSESLFSVVHKS